MDKVTQILADARYILLTTFRRDGNPVPTPVWVVGDGGSLAVWTSRDTGKVKRIRLDGKVEVAPCDFRGRPFGDSVPARARLLPEDETERVHDLLIRKYGLRARLVHTLLGRVKPDQRVALSITVS
jgi:PPOX class probable F420-dependent enzyme